MMLRCQAPSLSTFPSASPDCRLIRQYKWITPRSAFIENGRTDQLEEEPWNIHREASGSVSNLVYPAIAIPEATFERIKDRPVRVEVDYWLTLVEVVTSQALPALGGDQRIPNIGHFRTRINDQQTAVEYSWLDPAVCFHSFLEYMPTGQKNPARFGCGPYTSLASIVQNPLFPRRLQKPNVVLPFRDPAGSAHFPVDGSKLRESRAVLQLYRVRDHFTRLEGS
jgi:hypothetical protein